MKITAQEEYGLRCMLMLAKAGPKSPLAIPEISRSEGLSIPYIGKLLMILRKAGLIRAVRGRRGGYVLASAPSKIALSDVIRALGEPLYGPAHCRRYTGDYEDCVHNADCNVRDMWRSFDRFINGILDKLTLADLMNGNYELLRESTAVEYESTGRAVIPDAFAKSKSGKSELR